MKKTTLPTRRANAGILAPFLSEPGLLNRCRRMCGPASLIFPCEFATRMRNAGLGNDDSGYELPITKEQLRDAVGLTSVHVNRTLKPLTAEGLIERNKRFIQFDDWQRLRAVGDFSSLGLHLDQAGAVAA